MFEWSRITLWVLNFSWISTILLPIFDTTVSARSHSIWTYSSAWVCTWICELFLCFRFTSNVQIADSSSIARSLELIYHQLLLYLQDKSQEYKIQLAESSLSIDSVLISVERIDEKNKRVFVTWTNQDEEVGKIVLHVLKTMSNTQGTSYQPIEVS